MKVKDLLKILKDCNDNSEIIIFAKTENEKYRPFYNINTFILNENSFKEEVHLEISINSEYKSIHFPNNPTKEEIEDLLDARNMLMEELEDLNKQLKGFI